MVISAINALTLSPALCSVLLKPGHPVGIMQRVTKAIDSIADGYASIVRRLVAVASLSIVALAIVAAGIFFVFKLRPRGFLPDEDKGFLITVLNLPAGASLNRTAGCRAQGGSRSSARIPRSNPSPAFWVSTSSAVARPPTVASSSCA